MDVAWGLLFGAVAGVSLLAFLAAPTVRAFAKTPASDLSRIRADFERSQANARSGKHIVDIAHVGARLPIRSKAARRVYSVALQRLKALAGIVRAAAGLYACFDSAKATAASIRFVLFTGRLAASTASAYSFWWVKRAPRQPFRALAAFRRRPNRPSDLRCG